jgi:hypothetical protein
MKGMIKFFGKQSRLFFAIAIAMIIGFSMAGCDGITTPIDNPGNNQNPGSNQNPGNNQNPDESDFIAVTGISGIEETIILGTNYSLKATVSPTTATNKTIAWSIENPGTTEATISGSVLKTNKVGTVVVKATIANGTAIGAHYTKPFSIDVVPLIAVTSITEIPTTLAVGTQFLSPTVVPANATHKDIVWSVVSANDNPTDAIFFENYVDTLKAGKLNLRATIKDGKAVGTAYTQDFPIDITEAAFVATNGISGVPEKGTATVDLKLTGTVAPTNATHRLIRWSVKSPGNTGAKFDPADSNILKTTTAGKVTVTATIRNGKSTSENFTKDFDIEISPITIVAVTKINSVPSEGTVGVELTLDGTVEPEDATHQTIVWSVKDKGTTNASIASGTNILKATAEGTATVTATIKDGTASGNYTQNFGIDIIPFVAVDKITGVPTTGTVGTPLTLGGTVEPATATHKDIVWSVKTAGTTGATITGDKLTATAAGNVTVTATIVHGTSPAVNYSKEFDITIGPKTSDFVPVRNISISGFFDDALTLQLPNHQVHIVSVIPEDATKTSIIWETEGEEYVTINYFSDSNSIVLNPKAVGSAKLKATIANGATSSTPYTKEFTINIIPSPPDELVIHSYRDESDHTKFVFHVSGISEVDSYSYTVQGSPVSPVDNKITVLSGLSADDLQKLTVMAIKGDDEFSKSIYGMLKFNPTNPTNKANKVVAAWLPFLKYGWNNNFIREILDGVNNDDEITNEKVKGYDDDLLFDCTEKIIEGLNKPPANKKLNTNAETGLFKLWFNGVFMGGGDLDSKVKTQLLKELNKYAEGID